MASTYTPIQLGIKAPPGGFQTGGWYDGRQYWNGTFSDRGVIHPESNQQGAGQAVSAEVNAQSAQAQGVSYENFSSFLDGVSANSLQPPTAPFYTQNSGTTNFITGLNQEVNQARSVLDKYLADQRNQIQGQIKDARDQEAGALMQIEQLTTPFRENLEKSERLRLGTDEVLAAQRMLLGELDQLLTEGNNLIRQQRETTGLAAIRNPRIQKTMDDVAARAGVINAVVSLQNTYLANAYQSIDRSINAISQDRQERLSYYETILNLANRDIISLTAEDRDLAKEQTNLLKLDLQRSTETVDYVKKLMINPDSALVMAQSGVTLNDSIEVINQKMAEYQYSKEVRDASNQLTQQGAVLVSSPTGIPSTQLKSFTDSRGKTWYYKIPKATGTSSVGSANEYLKSLLQGGVDLTSPISNDTPQSSSTFTDEAPPQFSPAGGIGSIHVKASGSMWQYFHTGWVRVQ